MLDALFVLVDAVRSTIAVVGTVLLALTAPWARDPGPALPLEPCHLRGLSEAVPCGVLWVEEDRDSPNGRRLPIHVSVVPALVRDKAPDPLVVLAGGPGQGARSYGPLVNAAFRRVRRTRDLVLVDLRGTGDSARLDCPAAAHPIALLAIETDARTAAVRCRAALGRDPRLYTHRQALADLADVLDALGHARVNLWGGSWGTRSALAFASAYPTRVRSVVLDGAVAMDLDFPWSYPTDAQAAFDRLLADCDEDPACRTASPDARARTARWLASLDASPGRSAVRHPRTGAPLELRITRAAATEAIRAALYDPRESSRLLLVIDQAERGDLGPLLAMAERAANWSVDTMALGQTLSILCSEDVPRARPVALPDTLFGRSAIDFWVDSCREWPAGPALSIVATTTSAAPALILSGGLDPVTPPARGEAMRRHFPDSVHVIAPGGGHNVSSIGCIPRLIAEFLERGQGDALDVSCASAIARPPFVTSLAGGRP